MENKFATMVHEEPIILSNLLDAVYVHDYSYMMSDDDRTWTRGNNHEKQIESMIDTLITDLCVDPVDLCKQLLACRSEQYADGLTHRVIKSWISSYM